MGPRRGTIGRMSDLITRLVPVLHAPDPGAERRFYELLGWRATYEAPSTRVSSRSAMTPWSSGSAAVPPPVRRRPGLTWQPGISDADAAITACEQTGLQYEVTTERRRADWTYRIVKVQSPNGMESTARRAAAGGLKVGCAPARS